MLKSEFENFIKDEITDDDYLVVEMVYMNYPGIDEKEQVANLYKAFGIKIFLDMAPRAEKILNIRDEIRQLKYDILDKERELTKMQTCKYLI